MHDIECPYCEAGLEVCHDDGQGYDEDRAHEMQCSACEKHFVFYTSISFHYRPSKADCLNGSPHKFADWRKLWLNAKFEEVQSRQCRDCGECEQRTVRSASPVAP